SLTRISLVVSVMISLELPLILLTLFYNLLLKMLTPLTITFPFQVSRSIIRKFISHHQNPSQNPLLSFTCMDYPSYNLQQSLPQLTKPSHPIVILRRLLPFSSM